MPRFESLDDVLAMDFDSLRARLQPAASGMGSGRALEGPFDAPPLGGRLPPRAAPRARAAPTPAAAAAMPTRPASTAASEAPWSYEELLQLDENNVKRGIPESQLGRVMRQATGARGECAVCREPLSGGGAGAVVSLTKCGHAFHAACVSPWFREHRTCPVCRVELVA